MSIRKRQRRVEAEARNAAWAALPASEKLARLGERPGSSARQTLRVLKGEAELLPEERLLRAIFGDA